MGKLVPPEPFELDARRAMTPARKARIHAAWGGKCCICRQPVPVDGPGVEYDHVIQLWLKGSDADEDIGPAHAKPCHELKTKLDAAIRAKTKRRNQKHFGERKPSRLQGRPFDKRLTRHVNGTTTARRNRAQDAQS